MVLPVLCPFVCETIPWLAVYSQLIIPAPSGSLTFGAAVRLTALGVLESICKYISSHLRVVLGTKIPSRANLIQAGWSTAPSHPQKAAGAGPKDIF